MSRSYCSYDEEWQRRKSILIRSLFHDIPILSPVPEESNDSITYTPAQEVFTSPPRPYSPLPPLIIERVPIINKHDEPEEYYRKLHNKIKKIYIKLFIENRSLDSEEYRSIYSDSVVHDDDLMEADESVENLDVNFLDNNPLDIDSDVSVNEDARESGRESNSTKSDGYGADFESMDTEIIDVVNYTAMDENEVMNYQEEDIETDLIDEEYSETIDAEIREPNTVRKSVEDEKNIPRHSITDDHVMTESKSTSETESSQSKDEETIEKTSKTYESKEIKGSSKEIESNDNEQVSNEETNEQSFEEQEFNDDIDEHQTSAKTNKIINDNELTVTTKSSKTEDNIIRSKDDSNDRRPTVSDDDNDFIRPVEEMEEDVETYISRESPDYRQITTEAIIHVDGSKDLEENESRIYEDSVRSVILPTRELKKLIVNGVADVEDIIEVLPLPVSEEHADPKPLSTSNTTESDTTFEEIEEMRTPRPDFSHETIPNTNRSDSKSPNEHTAFQQEVSFASSQTQNGVDNKMAEHRMSCDINEVLTSIFNDSGNKEEVAVLGRKRKLQEDKSVQASEMVSWDDIRRNFFVGTPKIFRLCACADHVCP